MFNEYFRYGVLAIDGKYLKVYKGFQDYRYISFCEELESAWWAGASICVKFKGNPHTCVVKNWGGSYDIIW